MKKEEIKEREYLSKVLKQLNNECLSIKLQLENKKQEIKDDTRLRGEAKDSMDHGEKITFRQIIEEKVKSCEQINERLQKIEKLKKSPYFGRFDFIKEKKSEAKKIYLGIYNFYNNKDKEPLIYDWRAPISSMFYNFELGKAQYEAPIGKINGKLILKRQFRIRDEKMEYMLESSVNIMDDVLQKELSRSSDEEMKNIVGTIQRDQNLIIRDDNSSVLIIQGVAGSGKTSIALHRIAFLLYRFKETLNSDDILIISPNKVFSHYIANVLPELGEESVSEIQMEEIARQILGEKITFQTFFEQTTYLLENDDDLFKERIKFKSSYDFLKKIDQYVENVRKDLFISRDIIISDCFVPNWLFDEVFELYSSLQKEECISEMTKRIKQKMYNQYRYMLSPDETSDLKKKIKSMHQGLSLLETYKKMFAYLENKNLFKLLKNLKLEYSDVFPLIYLKLSLEGKGIKTKTVKHLIIDEMQDYSPVQYAVINKLFTCNKTILGDIYQSVNPFSSSKPELINKIFNNASYVQLNKSYRSTREIMNFVQKISANPELKTMKRHGQEPEILEFKDEMLEFKEIFNMAKSFLSSKFNTLAIICKTQEQAEKLSSRLNDYDLVNQLLSSESLLFKNGIIICTAHMAKGLEFDHVIVFSVNENNYFSLMDKNLLYVACTRAMHKLSLTYSGKITKLINNN